MEFRLKYCETLFKFQKNIFYSSTSNLSFTLANFPGSVIISYSPTVKTLYVTQIKKKKQAKLVVATPCAIYNQKKQKFRIHMPGTNDSFIL